jgi:transcriptional regulator with GAF, ATPase, and Fis domain
LVELRADAVDNAGGSTLEEVERDHILRTLENTAWRIKGPHGAAMRLDLQPSTLYSRMQKLGIPHQRQKYELSTESRHNLSQISVQHSGTEA